MSARTLKLVAVTTFVLLVMGVSAASALAWNTSVTEPVLSGTPHMGETFAVSGVTTPTAKKGVTTVVKIQVLMKMDGDMYSRWRVPVKARSASAAEAATSTRLRSPSP